ncbi:alpha-1,2-fucosyltransferase [Flavobacterium sp. ST-87]|uniref:Alpha-1,2-fucosyltransferase n=1 Tax=Flavobacterium plantiphilum TaxID=3163297 RepID=A0ABW8XXN7_9FLAO
MVVYSRLGSKGNLGNHLFQIASTIGIAIKNGHAFSFPEWIYSKSFKKSLPVYDTTLEYKNIKEKAYNYSTIHLDKGNYDLNGWFQSEKYFDTEAVKKQFQFNEELVNEVKEKYKKTLSKKNLLISVRRGDFVNNPYYYQLDYKYYFLAITTKFPDWKERNLVFTSDSINYCKQHFKFLSNAIFIDKSNVVEQLVLASLCDDYIISNSTFSWWQAWLGEKENTKIVRPIQNFRGDFSIKNNDKDYFPDRWSPFNSVSETIPYRYWVLILKGEYFKFLDLIKYKNKFYQKKLKKFIKKIIKKEEYY